MCFSERFVKVYYFESVSHHFNTPGGGVTTLMTSLVLNTHIIQYHVLLPALLKDGRREFQFHFRDLSTHTLYPEKGTAKEKLRRALFVN